MYDVVFKANEAEPNELRYRKMQPMKQTASNIAASAKSGMDKTKATVQEKVERMTSKDPLVKEEATMKKDAKIAQAEIEKQEARAHNAATATGPHSYSPTGPTGTHQVTALPGHVTEGVVGSHPVGPNTGTGPFGPTVHKY